MSANSSNDPTLTNGQEKQCRICLDEDNPNDLISPCLCSGGSAYVHRTCLNNWRAENLGDRSFKSCNVCQFEYVIETVITDPKAERERLLKYHLFVLRDSAALILLIQSVVLGLAWLLKVIDKKNQHIKQMFPDSMQGFSVYYLSSFILLMALLGLITLIIIFCVGATNTNTNRSSSGGSSVNKKGLITSAVAVVIICAVVGLVVGIIISVFILRKIMKHHTSKLWLRQEAQKYIVKDFQGRRQELEKIKRTRASAH